MGGIGCVTIYVSLLPSYKKKNKTCLETIKKPLLMHDKFCVAAEVRKIGLFEVVRVRTRHFHYIRESKKYVEESKIYVELDIPLP